MMPCHIKNDSKTLPLWDVGGHDSGNTQRVVDIINQCRYLASKRGMNLKEIRQRMREDEAKQRQLIRYVDICNKQMQYVNPSRITGMANAEVATYPSWFTHLNSHGMIYSQYSVQNYGNTDLKTVTKDQHKRCLPIKKHCHAIPKTRQSDWEHHKHNKESQVKAEAEGDTTNFTKDNLFKSTCHHLTPSTSDYIESKNSDDNVLSLLYRANLSNRVNSECNTSMKISPMCGNNCMKNYTPGTSSTIIMKDMDMDFIKVPRRIKEESTGSSCCKGSDATSKCNLPRKLATHNLASLCAAADDEEDSTVMTIARSDSSLLDSEQNSDSELDVSEIQIVEEMDQGKTVVSPLIKKAETALADLQKSDPLFGTMDDFGNLMKQANYIML